jgi:CelD/BcsL family acetyltransferase involved in cellulose biosynthesis
VARLAANLVCDLISVMTIAFELPAQLNHERAVVSAERGGVGVIDKVAEEWRNLCANSADDQPFYRPEWIRAHLRAFFPGAKIMLVTVRHDGRLRLVLPLVEEKGTVGGIPVRILRAPVNAHGGRFDVVRSSGAGGDAAISAAWQFLKELEVWDVLQFGNAPQGGTADRLAAMAGEDGFHTVRVPERPNPYVPVPADPELRDRLPPNPKLRSQLRQARRRLAEKGSLSFRRLETADGKTLQRFYRLEASGWKGKEGSAILCNQATRNFYNEMAVSAARFGYFSLYTLELNGQLLAGHYSFTHCGRCYSPKVAYDESFKQFAPGHLIMAEILQDCALRGIQGFDITGPNDDWKMKWTNQTRAVNHHFVFKGTMGNLAHAVRFWLRPAIARRLHRKPKTA